MTTERYEHLGPRRRGIASVEQGVQVLEAVVDLQGEATLTSIAAYVGLDASQTHRYLSSLVNCGMLQQARSSGPYSLGPAAVRTGLAAIAKHAPTERAVLAAERLAEASGLTGLAAIWGPRGATLINWTAGKAPIYTRLSLGSILPLTTTAMGRMFLAFLPEHFLHDRLEHEGHRAHLALNPDLVQARRALRQSFYDVAPNDIIPGVTMAAAPVFGVAGALVAVLGVAAFGLEFAAQGQEPQQRLLAQCAAATEDLGGHWPGPPA